MEQNTNEEKIQTNKMPYKEKVKRVIFNKFYIELIAYFIILFLGLILSSVVYTSKIENIVIIGGFVLSLIMCGIMYLFGYIIANKRKGLNKYFPVFCMLVIFLVIYIIDNLFHGSESKSFILQSMYNFDYMILSLHSIIFQWINTAFKTSIPKEVFTLIFPIVLFLSARRNRINEIKRIKREKMKEMINN